MVLCVHLIDAILAVKAHTVSYHQTEKATHNEEDEENAVIISPGSKQLKRKNRSVTSSLPLKGQHSSSARIHP